MGNTSNRPIDHLDIIHFISEKRWNELTVYMSNSNVSQNTKKAALLQKNKEDGWTAFHHACGNDAPFEILNKIVEIGGKELIEAKADGGWTSLHFACKYGVSKQELLQYLISVGGRDLVIQKDDLGWTALHEWCNNFLGMKADVFQEVIKLFIDVGGEELLSSRNQNNETALDIIANNSEVSQEARQELIAAVFN